MALQLLNVIGLAVEQQLLRSLLAGVLHHRMKFSGQSGAGLLVEQVAEARHNRRPHPMIIGPLPVFTPSKMSLRNAA